MGIFAELADNGLSGCRTVVRICCRKRGLQVVAHSPIFWSLSQVLVPGSKGVYENSLFNGPIGP